MTIADTAPPVPSPRTASPVRRLVIGAAIVLLLLAGGAAGATYYYDSVPLTENTVAHPVTLVSELPAPVANTFVAAVDVDSYEQNNSLITRRYVVLASGAEDESGLRTRVMARKAESAYTRPEILDRYLNRADYGRGAVGLAAAAQTYFQKPAEQLTVAEAALLAAQLHPERPEPRAGWDQVLNTMVDRGWLSATERASLIFPG